MANIVELYTEGQSNGVRDIQKCINNYSLDELISAWRLNDIYDLPIQLQNVQEILLDLEEHTYLKGVNITDDLSHMNALLNKVYEITNFTIRDGEEISRDINDIVISPDQIENDRFYNLCIENRDNMNILIQRLANFIQYIDNL